MVENFFDFLGEKPTLRSLMFEHRNKKRQFSCRQIQDEVRIRQQAMCQCSPCRTGGATSEPHDTLRALHLLNLAW